MATDGNVLKIRQLKPNDPDYPLAMRIVDNRERYNIIEIGDLVVVPLFQVLDAIASVKADYVTRDGIKRCPKCWHVIDDKDKPTDVIRVVRCKNCEKAELSTIGLDTYLWCKRYHERKDPDFYCGDGRRANG